MNDCLSNPLSIEIQDTESDSGNTPFIMTPSDEPMDSSNLFNEYFAAAELATERVATLVNDSFDCKTLFCQMDMLRTYKNDLVWQEMARWIRYEEAVEEGGHRWSKPHVASLRMEALQDLQNILSTCPVILDSNARTMGEIADEVTDAWIKERPAVAFMKDHLTVILLKRHKFQHHTRRSDLKKRNSSSANLYKTQQEQNYMNEAYDSFDSLPKSSSQDFHSLALGELNKNLMRHVPAGSQVVNLLVGEINDLDRITAAFIRTKDPCNLGYITEVDLHTKFMFIVLGPKQYLGHCAEMSRCMGAMFTDEIFRCVAYRCKDRTDLLCGIQEFSLHLTVLPPGVWDPSTRIEPPEELPPQHYRKTPGPLTSSNSKLSLEKTDKKSENSTKEEESHVDRTEEESQVDQTLKRTGRLFGGLLQDIKRKIPYYKSDFKDAFHIQCIASFFFLFLATLTPNVTFGGLLGQATDNYMGTMECVLSAAVSGVLFALCSGQPLNILGSTGPMLVLEGVLYTFCHDQGWDFLPFRAWVGFWTGFFILLIVALDLSALVRYITRFTEESFACLIALIFIYEAFKKTFEIQKDSPVHFSPPSNYIGCLCVINDCTKKNLNLNNSVTSTQVTTNIRDSVSVNLTSVGMSSTTMEPATKSVSEYESECLRLGGVTSSDSCESAYIPDVFFFSLLLFFGTYFLATVLVHFRESLFFPMFIRQNVSDFAVLISIVIMVVIDAVCDLPTPKLHVPAEFKPTRPGRSWFINPISDKNPWWVILVSALPAILETILIFMDQQITAVIVNRKENQLKKGSGYHLDMLIVGILVVVLGVLGLPWFVAATVTALAHIMSLRKVSECTAPGEKPVFLGVREQRVAALLVGIFSGLAVLFTSVLRHIPMPVLYGVFLYMGVAPLSGMQLIQRILIIFMPTKYQPDYSYIRNVPIRRVHLFTLIQVICLAVLWVVKSVKVISIGFPLMVLIICFIRKALDRVFTQRELSWLDDILPAQQALFERQVHDKLSTIPEPVKEPETPVSTEEKNFFSEISGISGGEAFGRRAGATFVCKTDIDRIKAMTPEVIRSRRQSLSMVAKRKQDIGRVRQGGDSRRFSTPLLFARKMSVDVSSGILENPPVERQRRQHRSMSLPATIVDVSDEEQSSDADDTEVECHSEITKF
ncbi:electrogenic sodium bicarbonate cotransporter 1-like [Mercenaria mercenaria]|uniref:electrogenic sodium bicarbonate cotransporter 1-like n=1 Tax=Mercenaria mercenaria TaxID=6596 RepID=UPI00234EB618|nr:electrogenic sodium bicarbonate cotransporter 1-like [Mercenaria mercenaria]